MQSMSVIAIWKHSLAWILSYYDAKRGKLSRFFPKLFIFFVVLNIACYWWAMLTAYPEESFGNERVYYFLIQFPVGCLGALFDSLSFFVTIFIARRALRATSTSSYLSHLSIDLVIAVLATWWVLLVFSLSGWLVSWILQNPEYITQRTYVYEQRLVHVLEHPTHAENLKKIYFGCIMGISAILPTLTHLLLSMRSMLIYIRHTKN